MTGECVTLALEIQSLLAITHILYLDLWLNVDQDVWQQRLRPQGAVECNHTSEKGPDHHDDMNVPVLKRECKIGSVHGKRM